MALDGYVIFLSPLSLPPPSEPFLRRGQWTSTIDLWVFLVESLSIRFLVHSMLEVPNFAEHLHRVSTNPLRHKEVTYPMKISNWCMKTLAYLPPGPKLGVPFKKSQFPRLTYSEGRQRCLSENLDLPSPEGNPGWWTMVQFPFFKSTTTWKQCLFHVDRTGELRQGWHYMFHFQGAYFGMFYTSCVILKRNMFQSNILI